MRNLLWFLLGVIGGFVVAHLMNKDPRGHEVLADVDARITEFTDRIGDAYREQEARFSGIVDGVKDAANDAYGAAKPATFDVVDIPKSAAPDTVDAAKQQVADAVQSVESAAVDAFDAVDPAVDDADVPAAAVPAAAANRSSDTGADATDTPGSAEKKLTD